MMVSEHNFKHFGSNAFILPVMWEGEAIYFNSYFIHSFNDKTLAMLVYIISPNDLN